MVYLTDIPENTDTLVQELVSLGIAGVEYSTVLHLVTYSSGTLRELSIFWLLGEWDGQDWPTLPSEKVNSGNIDTAEILTASFFFLLLSDLKSLTLSTVHMTHWLVGSAQQLEHLALDCGNALTSGLVAKFLYTLPSSCLSFSMLQEG